SVSGSTSRNTRGFTSTADKDANDYESGGRRAQPAAQGPVALRRPFDIRRNTRRLVRRVGLARDQFGAVVVDHGQQLLVVNVPEGPPCLVLAQESQVSEQLAEADIRGHFA